MPERDGWPAGQPGPAFGDVMAGSAPPARSPPLCSANAPVRAASSTSRCWPPPCGRSRRWSSPRSSSGSRRSPGGGIASSPEPGRRRLPDRRRPVHQPDPAPERQVLGRLSSSGWACPTWPPTSASPTPPARAQNSAECIDRSLDEAFGAHPLSHWKEVLADFEGVWTPFQTLDELYEDPQVIANGYLPVDERRQRTGGPAGGQPGPVRRATVEVSRPPSTASTPRRSSWMPATTGSSWPR
jgi:hypothetical protein